MMGKTWQGHLARTLAVLSVVAFSAYAAESTDLEVKTVRDPLRQLGRGVSNLFTGIMEVPSNVNAVATENGDVAGVTWGLFRGVWRCAIRETVGVFETVTFPFGWDPILEPEFPFEPGKSTEWRVNSPAFFQQ